MKKTIATATLMLATLLGGCDESAAELTPVEHESLTDLDLLPADELIDPDAPEPEDEHDTPAGPGGLVHDNSSEAPNPSNVGWTISPGITCSNDSQCGAGGRCDFVNVPDSTTYRCVGPCNADADCQQGETCGSDGYCDILTKGHLDFCKNGGCQRGHGDCDFNADCDTGLACVQDAGAAWGYMWNRDVCDYPAGHARYCSTAHPCSWGQGDCDPHRPGECSFGTVCKDNRGPQFGFASWVDVCLYPWQ